ncbi:trehalose-6-phosphate synthase [Pseudoxanthobacter sp.]|uniref:alpha,alpha-trehalose-phosphate synthase (UDP-forming) n=1 Tax=Pseudoxanthobacter sp. TaxID=1925742 RepID=UPI002FDF68D1
MRRTAGPPGGAGVGRLVGRFLRLRVVQWGALAAAVAGVLFLALSPLAYLLVEGWSRQDTELRAGLVFRSLAEPVAGALEQGGDPAPLLARFAGDERLVGIALCGAGGTLRAASPAFPAAVACTPAKSNVRIVPDGARRLHVTAFALPPAADGARLLVVHDLSFLDERAARARLYTLLALVSAFAGFGLVALAVTAVVTRGFRRRRPASPALPPAPASPLAREFQSMMHELRGERKFTDGIYVEWSPRTLRQLMTEELPGVEMMVVSNREPYIHNYDAEGRIVLQRPASGLVSALEPVMRACGGTWIAHGTGTADAATVDAGDHIGVPPERPDYTLRRVWLSDEEIEGYYYGVANEALWPLCHIAFVRPTFREQDWLQYKAVNARFADIVAAEATTEDPIVLVQDYHFALAPRMIRERLPKATIVTFWHIPWPNAETFGICPWREEIIDGLLGSTILGFHTRSHCNNFLEAGDRFMESRIDREMGSVTLGGHETLIRPYPISIEWPPAALAGQAPVAECRAAVRARLGLAPDIRLAVGIERFDYTKGILDRMHAVDDLMSCHPEWAGRFAFIQAAAPTRSRLAAYHALQEEATALAADINARHGRDGWQPIHLVIRHHDQSEVCELFRAADLCVVSSLHDGMNLVAKEFVAARDDGQGVLILSSFAGASRELNEAVLVNPFDAHGMAEAMAAALSMPPAEQSERMRLMREQVRQRNVHRWAAQMLLHARRMRRRERVAGFSAGDDREEEEVALRMGGGRLPA